MLLSAQIHIPGKMPDKPAGVNAVESPECGHSKPEAGFVLHQGAGGFFFRSLKTCRRRGIWAKSFGRLTACLLFKIDSKGNTGTLIPCHRTRMARRNAASNPPMPSTLGRKFTSVSSSSAATVGANMVPPSRTIIAVNRTNWRSGSSTQKSVSMVVAGTP